MNCIIRNAQMSDYDSVVRILNQGQALHINWRPDIYKPNDALLPKAVFEEIVKGDTFYIAENEGNVIGILELIFRHIESPAQVTRDIVFIDTMAVDEPYRGMGVGHLFFEKVKEIIPYSTLNTTIRNCPNGLPFALKIKEVTPIKEAISVKMLSLSKIIKETNISITDMHHKEISVFVK